MKKNVPDPTPPRQPLTAEMRELLRTLAGRHKDIARAVAALGAELEGLQAAVQPTRTAERPNSEPEEQHETNAEFWERACGTCDDAPAGPDGDCEACSRFHAQMARELTEEFPGTGGTRGVPPSSVLPHPAHPDSALDDFATATPGLVHAARKSAQTLRVCADYRIGRGGGICELPGWRLWPHRSCQRASRAFIYATTCKLAGAMGDACATMPCAPPVPPFPRLSSWSTCPMCPVCGQRLWPSLPRCEPCGVVL